MALTDLQIINTALVKLGAFKITSLGDGSTEAEMASALYAPVRDALLSAYPWGFATAQVTLSTPSVTPPVADYSVAFDLPDDHLRTLSVGAGGDGAGVSYRQAGLRIECDTSPITITYIRRLDAGDYPPYFDMVLVARLAAELCVPLTENASRAEVMFKIADQEYARARSVDAQQDTPSRIARYSLVDVRG